jgi:hypothetical protein
VSVCFRTQIAPPASPGVTARLSFQKLPIFLLLDSLMPHFVHLSTDGSSV